MLGNLLQDGQVVLEGTTFHVQPRMKRNRAHYTTSLDRHTGLNGQTLNRIARRSLCGFVAGAWELRSKDLNVRGKFFVLNQLGHQLLWHTAAQQFLHQHRFLGTRLLELVFQRAQSGSRNGSRRRQRFESCNLLLGDFLASQRFQQLGLSIDERLICDLYGEQRPVLPKTLSRQDVDILHNSRHGG